MNGNNGWFTAHAKINLLDERFLPVENSGTVSEWQLELPANFREGDPVRVHGVCQRGLTQPKPVTMDAVHTEARALISR